MMKPKALIPKFQGTNCDVETAYALKQAGFEVDVIPLAALTAKQIPEYQLLVLAGGFSYGDYVMAGRLAQLNLEERLGGALGDYYANGGYLLGICNGFQILSRIGILPEVSLIENTSGRFVCQWSKLQVTAHGNSFLQGVPTEIELPVAHAEGRFVTRTPAEATELVRQGRVVLRYRDNFNGSMEAVAGLQDAEGRVLGLMPHPERFVNCHQHYDPDWAEAEQGWGAKMFASIAQRLQER